MLSRLLTRDGHVVTSASDGREAIGLSARSQFDVVLLDVALGPGPAGYEVCRVLRDRGDVVPIVMLTALDSEGDAVLALEAGADDYVRKPFGPDELRSRIRAVLRRGTWRRGPQAVQTVGELSIDRAQRTVTRRGAPVELTFSEFAVLAMLMESPGRVLDREQLLEAVWGDSAYRDPRGIDVHVRHLRLKLEDEPEQPRLIQTVRGSGYRASAA